MGVFNPRRCGAGFLRIAGLIVCLAGLADTARAQKSTIEDAWWTYQQDCNGDGCKAGTLTGDFARLNWAPAVTNCNGNLNVYEVVSYRLCGTAPWTPIYTNAPHVISACQSHNQQYVDISMGGNCACRDYLISIYRVGQATADYLRSSTNDTHLSHHSEQPLAADFCLSDFFATCVTLADKVGSEYDNNSTAAKEPGEPDHAGNPGGKSLWYCWTATTNRAVTFDTIGSSFDTLLAVYTGNSMGTLTLVTNNDDIAGANNRQSSATFIPVTGTTYHLAVDGYGGAAGNVVLNWNQTGSALPDLIIWGPAAIPQIITRTFTSNTSDANYCDYAEGCATLGTRTLLTFTTETRNIGAGDLVMGSPTNNALFYWASCHKHWHFEHFANYNLLTTNGDLVYATNGGVGTQVIGHKVGFCLEDVQPWSPTAGPLRYDCGNQGIKKGWADVYAGYNYIPNYPGLPCQYIDITGVAPGEYLLQLIVNPDNLLPESNLANNVTLVPVTVPPANCPGGSAPANDNFANATVVTETPFSAAMFNKCATKQSGEPNHAGNSGGHSIWYSWTPTSNHTAVITTKQSDFDTLLAVYTGDTLGGLSLVASNDDIVANSYKVSSVTFAAVAGTTYRIAVDGFNGGSSASVGIAVLNINPPGNDDFTNNLLITGAAGFVSGYTIGAGKETPEPAHAGDVGGHSVWYRWVAPTNGFVCFNTDGSSFDTTMAVYTNTTYPPNASNMTAIAANDEDSATPGTHCSRVQFTATAGKTYRIAVDGFGGDLGNLNLQWNMNARLAIQPLPDDVVQLTLSGVSGQRYQLLTSSNLLNWTPLINLSVSGDTQIYNDPAAAGAKFYRAVSIP